MLNGRAVVLVLFFCVLTALVVVAVFWQLNSRRRTQVAAADGTELRQLTEEYRRLSELAVTAREHTDLRLEEIKTQLSHLRQQLDSVQKILSDVE